MRNNRFSRIIAVVFFFSVSCVLTPGEKEQSSKVNITQTTNFKYPLDPEYNNTWYVSQSWCQHCEDANDHPDNTFGEYFCDEGSHCMDWCSKCRFGWDFSLPGSADDGKLVLASGDGEVKDVVDKGVLGLQQLGLPFGFRSRVDWWIKISKPQIYGTKVNPSRIY